jgi:excisionase family DNA binding protein
MATVRDEPSDDLSAAEVAELLGCDISTVRRHIYKDAIPARRVGGVWIIRRIDLEQVA